MEMGDNPDNKQICRLCLDIVPAANAEAIGQKKNTVLKVLLINVDLHVIENTVACSSCMEQVHSGFEFKSACLHVDNCISTFVDADIPVDIKEVFHGEMRGTALTNVNLENYQICRLCMSLIADEALDFNTDLKDIIANCLPEVDIHTVHEPLVCGLCFTRMKKLNDFMRTCQKVERTINIYCQGAVDHTIPVSVSLIDLLKFKDSTNSSLVKDECSNFDSNTLKHLKKDDISSIECEEIHIKTELESGDEMGDSVLSGAYNNSGNSVCIQRKRQITQCASKGLSKEFACQECTYKTDRSILARHMVGHRDKSEVEMHHKCEICEYETKYKNNMMQHMLRHRDPKVEKKFKCDKCPYETDLKYLLSRHSLIHKDKSEVEMHKCKICGYETRYKGDLKKHMVKHRAPKAERKFKCDQCTYETDFKSSLHTHNLIHKDRSEVEMHKCDNCEYKATHKSSMIRHMLKHCNPIAEKKFKCDKCSYETYYNFSLRTHSLIHKDILEVEMHKCENCGYETRHKRNMNRHMRGHMVGHRDLKAEKEFKCDKCPYETDQKHHLSRHTVIHKDKSEVEMHKCENCEFETMHKRSIVQHMQRTHRNPKAERKF